MTQENPNDVGKQSILQRVRHRLAPTSNQANVDGQKRSSMSRRRYLQTAAASGATGALVGTGVVGARGRNGFNSEEYLDRVYEQALRIREKTGRHEAFVKHLRNSNLAMKRGWSRSPVSELREEEDDGPSTQYLPQDEDYFSQSLTLTYPCESDRMWIDYWWSHDTVCTAGMNSGENPPDIAGMHWQSDDYTYIADTKYTGNSNTYLDAHHGDIESNGLVCEYDDKQETWDETNGGYDCPVTISSYFGGKVGIENDQDPELRTINADYRHYYNTSSCSISGVSLGSDGVISVSFSCNSNIDSWESQDYKGEEDATEACCSSSPCPEQ